MRYFKIRHWYSAAILVPVLGIAVSYAQQKTIQQESIPGIRAANRTVLSSPEGDPLNMPSDVAVGTNGDIYVLDGVNHRVVVYDVEGKFSFQFGSYGCELGQLCFPLGITTDRNGRVYIADSGNHRFQVFESNGKPLDAIPLLLDQTGIPPDPADLVIDPNQERLYITDNDNHHVLVYNLTDHNFESVWGSPGQNQLQFRFPFLMDISPQGYLLIVEPINTRVQVLNPNGKFVNFIGSWGIKPGQLFRPKGVAIYKDQVYVTDSYLGNIKVFDIRGSFLGILTDETGVPMKFTTPTGITIDTNRKRLYVVELKANRVCRLDLE